MDTDLALKLAEKVGPWVTLFVVLGVHHWRKRKRDDVAPVDTHLVWKRLGLMLDRIEDLFESLQDRENDARERHRKLMDRLDEVEQAAKKRWIA